MSNPLSKVCSTVVPGELYQTAIDGRWLAVDSRVGDQVHFTVIDLTHGDTAGQLSPDTIDAWHSLVAINGDQLFLQYFENKKNPDLVSLVSMNWQTENIHEIDHLPDPSQVDTPLWLSEGSEGFSSIKQFLRKEAVLGCEYLENDTLAVISYYLGAESSFSRFIIVLKDGVEVLHQMQDNDLKGFAPGSFFTTENRLIFARQKNEINIYEI